MSTKAQNRRAKEFRNRWSLLVNGVDLSGTGAGLACTGKLSLVAGLSARPDVVALGGSLLATDVVTFAEVMSGVPSSPAALLRDQDKSSGEPVPAKAVVFRD